jgi:hypothetical protein
VTGTGSRHHDGAIAASSLPDSFTPPDERLHAPTSDPHWEEWWYFDFVGDDRLAGFARLGLRGGRAWWWTAITGPDRPLVLVRDHDVDPPRGGTLEIRASGLWAEPVCETPFDHWSLGLEAMAVALDDPTEAYGRERGDPVPLGLALEWEASARPRRWPERQSYGQPSQVHGEVLVGQERLMVTGFGMREHGWGLVDWWGRRWSWATGHLEEGTPFGGGWEGRTVIDLDQEGLMAGGWLGPTARLHPVAHAPIQVPGGPHARISHLARAVCRVAIEDGSTGWGWAERLQPA